MGWSTYNFFSRYIPSKNAIYPSSRELSIFSWGQPRVRYVTSKCLWKVNECSRAFSDWVSIFFPRSLHTAMYCHATIYSGRYSLFIFTVLRLKVHFPPFIFDSAWVFHLPGCLLLYNAVWTFWYKVSNDLTVTFPSSHFLLPILLSYEKKRFLIIEINYTLDRYIIASVR